MNTRLIDRPSPAQVLAKERAKAEREKLIAKAEFALQCDPDVAHTWETEYQFDPTRKWRFDIAWVDTRPSLPHAPTDPGPGVALEIHGGVYSNGRHTRGKGFRNDRIKMAEAQLQGWIVIEATSDMIDDGTMIDLVKRALGAEV